MNRRLSISNGFVEGWYCKFCNGYNDITQLRCNHCQIDNLSDSPNLINCSHYTFVRRGCIDTLIAMSENSDEKRYELHSRFFTEERMIVKDLDNAQLIERIQELDEIVLIAKARLNGAQAEERERKAKLRIEQKDFWPSSPDSSITDAIAPKKQARKSKLDKLYEDLQKLGVANADSMIRNVVNKNTQIVEKQVKRHEKEIATQYENSVHAKLITKPVRTEAEDDSERSERIGGIHKPNIFDPASLNLNKTSKPTNNG